jgi:hypothetical protein
MVARRAGIRKPPACPASPRRPRGVRHAYSGALAYFTFMKLW